MTGLVTELVEPPTESVTEAGVPTERGRSTFSLGMLALALAPIVASVVRAIATRWVPIFDAGYFTVRSRDLLTEHHPFLGAWSSASATLDAKIRNFGPLQLDLLAPFTKVEPYGGTAVGVGVVATASVVAVWWSARRVLGPFGAGAAMLATVALEAAVGSQAFIDPRQQLYLLMPYWALLWLTWAMAAGVGAAVAPLVFTASLITQTHFTYLFQTALLVIAGVGLYVLNVRRRWHDAHATRWLLIGLAVGLVCWAQPLWDQIAGERNLGAVLADRSAAEGLGWTDGARVISGTVLLPPRLWFPDTMGEFVLPADMVSWWTACLALGSWLVLLVLSTALGWRRGHRSSAMIGLVGAIALIAAVVAGTRIPSSAFGLIPQNYLWMWPTGVFMTAGLAAGVMTSLSARGPPVDRRKGTVGFASAGLIVAIAACRPIDHFTPVPSSMTASARVARPVLEQLANSLERYAITGPLEVDYTRGTFVSYLGWVFLAELQRAEIAFTFPADDDNVYRYGHARCEHGQAEGRIVLADAGGDPTPRDGEVVLAHVDAFTSSDEAELHLLDRRFGGWLRDRTVGIDLSLVEFLGGPEMWGLRPILSSPGTPARGMASVLSVGSAWGAIDVPPELSDELDRWVDLQVRSAADEVTILLSPAVTDDDRGTRRVLAVACLR
jgi:hypothetical protein